jgi:hypothetical protein
MRCLLIILLLSLSVWAQPAPTTNKPSGEPLSATNTANSNTQTTQHAENNAPIWFSGALVFFAFCQVAVMAAQFIAMHKQAHYMRKGLHISVRSSRASTRSANAAKEAAKAAELSANAAINAERAWVSPRMERAPNSRSDWEFKAINDGKTPARIVGYSLAPYRLDVATLKLEQPEHPPTVPANIWVNGRDVQPIKTFDVFREIGYFVWENTPSTTKKLIFHGQIEYIVRAPEQY